MMILSFLPNDGIAQGNTDSQEILIVYLSRTNNTEAVAEIIRDEVGGKMVELKLEMPYPEDYETVFLGFPTWDMQLPPPMKSFLNEYDLNGKTVIPFNTHGGYGMGSGFQDVEERCPNCNILEGFSIKGGLERDGIYLDIKGERREEIRGQVFEWLRNIQIQ